MARRASRAGRSEEGEANRRWRRARLKSRRCTGADALCLSGGAGSSYTRDAEETPVSGGQFAACRGYQALHEWLPRRAARDSVVFDVYYGTLLRVVWRLVHSDQTEWVELEA